MRLPLLLVVFLLAAHVLMAQSLPFESATRKAWQPNQKVLATDFQAAPSEQFRRLEKQAGLLVDSRVSLSSVLDVPRRKRDRGPMLEKAYFAALWLKDQSATLTTDTAELAKHRIIFDLAELAARQARQSLQQLQDSTQAYGTVYIYYVPVANRACAWYYEQTAAYTKALYVDKNPAAYAEWRKLVRAALQATAAYATTTQDAQRLLTNQPVEPAYEKSATILGALGCK